MLELVASLASKVSIVGWVVAGLYQLYLNGKYDEVAGFSPLFLTGYVMGDIFNVIGTFWGRQMTFQKIIAICSLITDSLITLQYTYFRLQMAQRHQYRRSFSAIGKAPARVAVTAALFGLSHASKAVSASVSGAPISHGQHESINWEFLMGQTFSWLAQIFYVSAVIPQVWRNFQHKCTGGVSILLFASDLIGSFGYVATIISTADTMDDDAKIDFLYKELPYLLGATSCFVLDLILMVQYRVYPDFSEVEILQSYQTPAFEDSDASSDENVPVTSKPTSYGSI